MAKAQNLYFIGDEVYREFVYGCEADYFDAVRTEYKKRRDACYALLKKIPGVVCAEPGGAFI